MQNATDFRNLLQSTGTSNLKEFNRLVTENNKLSKQNSDLKSKIKLTMIIKAEIQNKDLLEIKMLTNAKKIRHKEQGIYNG